MTKVLSEEESKALAERWHKKKLHLSLMSSSLRSLRNNLTRDLKSEDDKDRLTALVISVMDCTAERVGNEDSEDNGHFGVTGLQKKHVKISGNTISLKYKGKSGVLQEKQFSDALLADAMRDAVLGSKSKFIFETPDGFRIKADRVNRYLKEYGVTAKDIRGYCANRYIINRLKKEEIPEEENKRKKAFNKAIKYASSKVGHGSTTLRNHYLVPELQEQFIAKGKIIDLNDFYRHGGKITPSPRRVAEPHVLIVEGEYFLLRRISLAEILQGAY